MIQSRGCAFAFSPIRTDWIAHLSTLQTRVC
jgi:hypothetical protein